MIKRHSSCDAGGYICWTKPQLGNGVCVLNPKPAVGSPVYYHSPKPMAPESIPSRMFQQDLK